jgi:hypothetical protein
MNNRSIMKSEQRGVRRATKIQTRRKIIMDTKKIRDSSNGPSLKDRKG